MKNSYILITLAFVFVLINSCKKVELQNQWAENPIVIDGDDPDWENLPLQYFEEPNVIVGSVNDEEYLYVMFRFNDQVLARKIQRFGVTVWTDKKGKKNKNYGIRYYGSIGVDRELEPEFEPPENIAEERRQRMEAMMGFRPQSGTITVIRGDEEISLPENSESGPSAGSASQQGIFCYEFKIPFPLGTELIKSVSLGIEIGGMNLKDFGQKDGGRPGGGMGRPGGGNGGPGRGGGMSKGQMFEKQEVWMKVVLAESKEHGS